ncbi:MAG TPA: protein translocase subunit SecDF [Bacteroidia bacterium]|jgi:SecD/SecF fusion protein|nr:protein translocase subunit SecDF [Bacteroidia bacterium]
MQNIKGAIRFFAILMAFSCLFYLSFSFVTRNWEKKANKYAVDYVKQPNIQDSIRKWAKNDSIRMSAITDSLITAREHFFLDDSIAGKKIYLGLYTYESCKDKELNLGLDLKGGMNVTLEVSSPDIVKALANFSTAPDFTQALAKATKAQLTSNEDFVTLFGKAYHEVNPLGHLSAIFAGQLKDDNITFSSTDEQVLAAMRLEANAAVDRAKLVLETRINKFGVAQPNIQHLQGTNRILVELPGVKDEARVKSLLVHSANLEFWETYNYSEVAQKLFDANEKLKLILGYKKDTLHADSTLKKADYTKAKTKKDSLRADSMANALFVKDLHRIDSLRKVNDSLDKKAGKTGPSPFGDHMAFQNQDEGGKGPVCFGIWVKDTALIGGYLRIPEIAAMFPHDLHWAWDVKPQTNTQGTPFLRLYALKAGHDGRASLMGDVVTDARKQFDRMNGNGSPEISMTMNTEGTRDWARLTKANIDRCVAIVLDNYVYTAPVVNGEIPNGTSSISGSFTNKEADDLVNVLNTGKLPAPTNIVASTVVGATLGEEAIKAGMLSFLVALIVVLIYMGFYYNKAGWVADIALFVNVFFIMGILSSLGAVLTLPGIAGIVLTIALSVDANILIFERVREELREGKSISNAIGDGYKHAMSSILDSNLTTLILGIILYSFGSGPVQGFATTLIIGIISSLFCAIFITRLVFDWMLKKEQKIKFSTPATENVLRNAKIDFVGRRKFYYLFSSAIIITGIIFYFKHNGFSLGVDFSGGRSYTVRFTGNVDRDKVREALKVQFGSAPEVKTAGGDDQLRITTNYLSVNVDSASDAIVLKKLKDGLQNSTGTYKNEVVSSIKVGPSIANEVIAKSFVVIIVSCLLMFLYILFRFRKWQYGLGAVAALVHDVLVVLSCYTIFDGILPFPLEIDQHFVAAILTVMGYSMTDTVVVFDRIREFLSSQGKDLATMEKRSTINYALNSTLTRTINTSMITFFVLLSIFIFGGDTIRGFSFALLIGIVIGTYSSLCIATPIVVDFDRRKDTGA